MSHAKLALLFSRRCSLWIIFNSGNPLQLGTPPLKKRRQSASAALGSADASRLRSGLWWCRWDKLSFTIFILRTITCKDLTFSVTTKGWKFPRLCLLDGDDQTAILLPRNVTNDVQLQSEPSATGKLKVEELVTVSQVCDCIVCIYFSYFKLGMLKPDFFQNRLPFV